MRRALGATGVTIRCASALLACVAVSGCLLPKLLATTPADTRAIVTIEDFSLWLDANALELEPDEENLVKQKIAWSYQLTYDYLGRAQTSPTRQLTVVLKSEVGVHPNETAARRNYNAYATGLKRGIRNGGGSVQQVEPTLRWGTGIDLFEIHRDGQQIGNGFIGYGGKTAVYVLITGLYSSNSALFEDAIRAKLEQLPSYDPKATSLAAAR